MNYLTYFTRKNQWLLVAALFAGMVACKDDEGDPSTPPTTNPPPTNEIVITDPNAVTKGLSITGASLKTGTPPSPSTDPAAPVLETYGDESATTAAFKGKTLSIELPTDDVVSGVYFKVKGSDSYFDVPSASLNQGGKANLEGVGVRLVNRKKGKGLAGGSRGIQFEQPVLEISLPENLQPGQFCAEYCVYDAENRVSNIVEVCIDVVAFGGANAEFLQAPWSLAYQTWTYDGIEETSTPGVPETYSYETTVYCEDGTSKEMVVESSWTTNYVYLTMAAGGGLSIEESYQDKYATDVSCDGIVYTEEAFVDTANGGWSYDAASKKLVLVFEYEDGEYTGTTAVQGTVEMKNNELHYRFDDIDGESSLLVFRKR